MNPNRILLLLVLLLHSIHLHAADPLTETFQKGLFEEEANRDLTAAVKAYEDVVRQLDGQRKLAATAGFRLGECYRKLGRTNDAVAQFQRITRQYSDDETLAKLSRQNLAGLGTKASAPAAPSGDQVARSQSVSEIALLEIQLEELKKHSAAELPDLILILFKAPRLEQIGAELMAWQNQLDTMRPGRSEKDLDVLATEELLKLSEVRLQEAAREFIAAKEVELTILKKVAARVETNTAGIRPAGDIAAQRAALEREIELAQQQLKIAQTQVSAGRATAEETIKAEREVLRLQRELAALPAGPADGVRSGIVATRGEFAAEVEAKVGWLKKLSSQDVVSAVLALMPTERMAELARQNAALLERISKEDDSRGEAKVFLKGKVRENDEMIAAEAQSVLRSLELKAEMLRAVEAAALGKAVRETAGAPDVRPLRITLSGAAGAPLILVYPNEFPAARIPAEHLTNPTVVIGTTILAEVVARANVIGANGKTNAIAIRRTEGGEEKQWRLDPAGKDAQGFELRDGDVIEVGRKVFVF